MKEEALKLADELENEWGQCDFEKASAMIRKLVEELDKQGEPYGYVWTSIKDCMETRFTKGKPLEVFYKPIDIVPVYTTPQTKPLSDEEIELVWYKHPDFVNGEGLDPIKFARAIEERHGIK